jgi:hypothetical protein
VASGKKTRFAAIVNGRDKIVFSVQEQKNGDLTLIIPAQGRVFDYGGSLIKNQKFSIHRSLNSENEAVTIKQTVELVDAPEFTTAQYRHRQEEGWLVDVYMQRIQSLSLEKYNLKTKSADRIVTLCHYDESINNLCYTVFLSATGVNLEHTSQPAWNYIFSDFEHFRVHVFFSYLYFRSMPYEDMIPSMTSLPRWGGVISPNDFKANPKPADENLVPVILDRMLGELCKRTIARAKLLQNGKDVSPNELPFFYTLFKEPRSTA